jgi:hypothetical protein
MASAVVYNALNAAITAAWTHTPIRLPATPADAPADNSAFLSVTYPLGIEYLASLGGVGSSVWRNEGGVRIALCLPSSIALNDPSQSWLERIDALRAALRGKLFGTVHTFEAGPPIIDESADQDAYFVLSFVVTYMADVIG